MCARTPSVENKKGRKLCRLAARLSKSKGLNKSNKRNHSIPQPAPEVPRNRLSETDPPPSSQSLALNLIAGRFYKMGCVTPEFSKKISCSKSKEAIPRTWICAGPTDFFNPSAVYFCSKGAASQPRGAAGEYGPRTERPTQDLHFGEIVAHQPI